MSCQSCNAPDGKPHATNCKTLANGVTCPDAITATRYPDSINQTSVMDGMRFQDYAVEQLARRFGFIIQLYTSKYYQLTHGESIQRCEIKLDKRCTDTGRLSIEIAEKTSINMLKFLDSGIYSPLRPIFYVQGNPSRIYLFATKDLLAHHKHIDNQFDEKPTIRTFYISLEEADRLCIAVITSAM